MTIMAPSNNEVSYSSYLKVDALLSLQEPLSQGPEHDELLFIVIHQTYELWFKQLIHELEKTQEVLRNGEGHRALALLGRSRTILKTLVSQVDILETMTPLQFNSFRDRLKSSSGFQSAQFREVEAIFGRRDSDIVRHLSADGTSQSRVLAAMSRDSLWDDVLGYLSRRGYHLPNSVLNRKRTEAYEPNAEVQEVLIDVYRNNPAEALLLEALVDVDEGVQEWRYRHVKMVERTIGHKMGTGGSSGAGYLISTLFRPVFADLWEIRSRF